MIASGASLSATAAGTATRNFKHYSAWIAAMSASAQGLDLTVYRQDKLKFKLASLVGRAQLTGFQRSGETDRKGDAKFAPF